MKTIYNYNGIELECEIKHNKASHGGSDTPSYPAYDELKAINYKGVEVSEIIDRDIITEIENKLNVEFEN